MTAIISGVDTAIVTIADGGAKIINDFSQSCNLAKLFAAVTDALSMQQNMLLKPFYDTAKVISNFGAFQGLIKRINDCVSFFFKDTDRTFNGNNSTKFWTQLAEGIQIPNLISVASKICLLVNGAICALDTALKVGLPCSLAKVVETIGSFSIFGAASGTITGAVQYITNVGMRLGIIGTVLEIADLARQVYLNSLTWALTIKLAASVLKVADMLLITVYPLKIISCLVGFVSFFIDEYGEKKMKRIWDEQRKIHEQLGRPLVTDATFQAALLAVNPPLPVIYPAPPQQFLGMNVFLQRDGRIA